MSGARRLTAAAFALCAMAVGAPAAQADVTPMSALGGIGNAGGQFREPGSVAIARDNAGDATGDLIVADTGNHRVQVLGTGGAFQRLFGLGVMGSFPPSYEVCTTGPLCAHGLASPALGALDSPAGIASTGWGSGPARIAVADTGNSRAQTYAADGSGPSSPGALGLNAPQAIAGDAAGSLYVADTVNSRVVVSSPSGSPTVIGGPGPGPGQFSFPGGIAVSGGSMYVADTGNNRVQKLSLPGGAFVAQWGTPGTGAGQFAFPTGVAVGPDGSVYVTDSLNQRVQKFTSGGTFLKTWGFGVATGSNTFEVCTADCYQGSTRDENEAFSVGQFRNPGGLDVDADGNVYVADTDNYRVQRFEQSPAMGLSPPALEYGNVPLGQGRDLTATVTNTGDGVLNVGVPSASGPDAAAFSGIGNGCAVTPNLSAGESCQVDVTFHPVHTGTSTATLSVPSGTPGVPTASVPLSGGAGTAAADYSPASLDFGVRPAPGPGAAQDVTVTSTSADDDLTVSSVQVTGAGAAAFDDATDCVGGSLGEDQQCTVSVGFDPATAGEYSATLEIASNAPEGTHSVPLRGSLRPPGLKVAPTVASFPSTAAGQFAVDRRLVVTSTGGSPLHVTAVDGGGPDSAQFPISSDCPGATLVRGSSCTILAGFRPTGGVGLRSASATIVSDAPGSSPVVTLLGSVTQPLIPVVKPAQKDLGRVKLKAKRRTRKARPVFRFSAAGDPAGFRVKLDGRRARLVGPVFRAPRLRRGKHVLRVNAVGAGGLQGPVSVFRFRRN